MKRIIAVHHPDLEKGLVEQSLGAFYRLRELDRLRKKPSTSELIDWIAVLKKSGISEIRLHEQLPFLGTLLKKEQDHVTYKELAKNSPGKSRS
jgi:MoxR-like ATPase